MAYTIIKNGSTKLFNTSLKEVYKKAVSDLREDAWLDAYDEHYNEDVSAYTITIGDNYNNRMVCQIVVRLWEIKGRGYIRTISTYRIADDGELLQSEVDCKFINVIK